MPVSEYYHGHGQAVLADMVRRYGPNAGKRAFYATANKRHQNPEDRKGKLRDLASRRK